jgi:hypothetical protein
MLVISLPRSKHFERIDKPSSAHLILVHTTSDEFSFPNIHIWDPVSFLYFRSNQNTTIGALALR